VAAPGLAVGGRTASADARPWAGSAKIFRRLRLIKPSCRDLFEKDYMAQLLYRCPETKRTVQVWVAEPPDGKAPDGGGESYETVRCLSCGQLHLVNPTTGKVLSRDRP
jgi:hypothetical protein